MGSGNERDGQSHGGGLDRRQASLVLSSLVLTPDELLEVYRRRRALAVETDLELLRQARDVLDQVSLAITRGDPDRRVRVARAWRALCEGVADDASGPAPSPPMPFAAEGAADSFVPERHEPAWLLSPEEMGLPAEPPPIALAGQVAAAPAAVGSAPVVAPAPTAAPDTPPPVPLPAPVPPPAAPSSAIGRQGDRPGWGGASRAEAIPAAPASASALPSRPAGTPDGSSAAALPFRKGEATPPAASPQEQAPVALGQTVAVDTMSPLANLVLPFETAAPVDGPPPSDAGRPPAEATAAATGAAAVPFRPPKPKPPPLRRPTKAKEAVAGAAGELPPHLQVLTLEHYAALCAECRVHPERVAAIQARYRVQSDAERALLDAHWRGRMGADGQLDERFRWLAHHYESWARQQSG